MFQKRNLGWRFISIDTVDAIKESLMTQAECREWEEKENQAAALRKKHWEGLMHWRLRIHCLEQQEWS